MSLRIQKDLKLVTLNSKGDANGFLINMPSLAWHVDDQAEPSVIFDDAVFKWTTEKR